MKFTVKVEGLKDLDAALGELPKSTAKATLRRVLMKAGAPIQEMAERLAPVRAEGGGEHTYKVNGETRVRRRGTTRALVQIGTRLTRRQASAARKAGKMFQEVYIGTRDRIARLVEYGTHEARAHPFLRPAWEAHKAEALHIISEELGAEIEKSAARLARKRAKQGG